MPDDPVIEWAKSFTASQPKADPIDSERSAIETGAAKLGVDPVDYATAMSYETGGTMNPWQKGPVTKWGQHRGTIQYGEPQQRKYGVSAKQSFQDQVTNSNVRYLQDAGVKPGATFEDIYKAINGGKVSAKLNTPDANTGRTIADNIRLALRGHQNKVIQRYGWTPEDVWGRVDNALGDTPAENTATQPDDIWNQVNDVISGPGKLPPIIPQPPQEPTQTLQTPPGIAPLPAVAPPVPVTPSLADTQPPDEAPAPPVVPEAPQTIESQIVSTMNADSPRKAVLLTDANQMPLLKNVTGLAQIRLPEGTLAVNYRKLGIRRQEVPAYVKKNGFASLLGKIEDVGNNTTTGSALVTKDANGNELSSSIVTTPQTAALQAQVDKAQFPQAATQEIKPAQAVVADRTAPISTEISTAQPSSLSDEPKIDDGEETAITPEQQAQINANAAKVPIVGTADVDPKLDPEGKIRQAANKLLVGRLTPTGEITSEDIDKWIQASKDAGVPVFLGNPNDSKVTIRQDMLDQIFNAKKKSPEQLAEELKQRVIAPPTDEAYRQRAIDELTAEHKDVANLNRLDRTIGEEPVKPEAPTEDEIQKRIAEYKSIEPTQEEKSRNYDAAQNESSFSQGIYSGVGGILHHAAGISRAMGITPGYEFLSRLGTNMQEASQFRNQGEGPKGATENVLNFAGESIPQFAELALTPGKSAILKFGALGGLGAAGRGENARGIAKETAAGAGQGGAFEASELFQNPLAKLGTVFGGSAAVSAAAGSPIDQTLQNAVVNTLFKAHETYGSKIAGQFFQFWKGGDPLTVGVTPQGEVILPKTDVQTENKIVLDPENPVYKTKSAEDFTNAPRTTEILKPQVTNEAKVSEPAASLAAETNISEAKVPSSDLEQVTEKTQNIGGTSTAEPNAAAPDITPENGFEITGQTGPTATSAIGKLVEQRNVARREANTDPLTGIANRRALDKALPTAEKEENTSVISFDANNFGQVNKQLGERAGDRVLVELGNAFKQAAEESNTGARVFRRGGDEFVMLAPEDKAEAIRDRAEQLFGERKYGDTNVSVSGTVGNNFEEANSKLQAAKAERKSRATIPADAQKVTEPAGEGNNPGESTTPQQGRQPGSEGTPGQTPAETKPSDTGQAKPDLTHDGRPAVRLEKQGKRVKIQYLDGGKETPWVLAKDTQPVEKTPTKKATVSEEEIRPTQKVYTERGTEANIETRAIPRSKILTSLDEGYPAELQPRDRSRAASKSQIEEMAGKLNPELLGDSPKASDGRPLVVPVDIDGETKYAVVSGNGRMEAIRRASGDAAKAYDEFVRSKGGKSGDVYAGVLDPKTDLETFAREANESSTAKMSATEQAQADAKDLDLSNFTPSDDGSIHTGANREFIKKFVANLPSSERGGLMLPDGTLSQEGVNRIRNAVFSKAYGDSEMGLAVIQRMAESTDNNIKRITTALLQNAPAFADLKENIDRGTRFAGLDITEDITKAVEKFSFLRENGDSVEEYLKQRGLFGEDLTPFQKRMVQVLDSTKNSAKALSGILNNYIGLSNALGDPKQMSIFTESREADSSSLFRQAVLEYERGNELAKPSTQIDLPNPDQGGEVQSQTGGTGTSDVSTSDEGSAAGSTAEESKTVQAVSSKSELKPQEYGSKNKIVTQDAAQKARELLAKRLGGSNTQFNSGIDPEILKAGAELAAYHIEAGARKFADFSAKMISDLGENIKPYLRELYNDVYREHNFKGMDEPTPEQIILTGIKKSIDEAERESMNLRDAPEVKPHKLQQANTEAAEIIAKDPFAGQKLVKELSERPRAISDTETAILVHYKRTIDNQYNSAIKGINEGFEKGDEQQIAENRARLATISDERQTIMDAGRKSGTEKGRALNAQKILMTEDFSLASLEAQKRAANGGRPLTDTERADLQKTADEYKARADQLEKHLNDRELELSGLKEKMPNPRIIEVAENIVKKLDQRANAARDRLKKRGAIFTSGLDPMALRDLAEIGASHVAKVGLDFIKFSDAMVKEFGEKIKPHLQNIYDASNKLVDGIEPNARERILAPKTPEEIAKKIGEKINDGDDSVSGLIQRLAKMFVAQGVKDRDELITKIHELVKGSIPDRRDVMDAISGYGKFKQLSKNEVDVALRDLKGQMQQIAKIEDMAGGKAPSKTGVERRTPSDAERQLIKQVEEAKRLGGYKVTDPATQLKTALQAAKTRLQNQITDLETQIARKERFVKIKSNLQYDNEANTLKTQRDELKKQFDAVFGTDMSDESRLRAWKNRTQKRISDLNQKIMTGDYAKSAPKKPMQFDAEAQKLKIEVERIKRQFQRELRKDQLKNRPMTEKILDGWAKYVRAGMLSWPTTLGKLTNAAMGRIILSPVEEGIKKGITKIPGFQQGQAAPTSSIRIEAAALAKGIIEGGRDAWMMLKNKDSGLDVLLGKEKYDHTPLEYFGQIHGALKAPVKRIAYERSLQKQIELGMKSGADVSDPLIQMQMSLKAYEDANREIFMQDSRVVNFVRRGLTALEAKDKEGKTNLGGLVGATAIRTVFPIMKIPVNYAGEVMKYTVGSITGTAKLGMAFAKGMENVSAAEKETILSHLSKGSVGLAAVSLGFFDPSMFGGYYTGKRDEKDVKAGGIRIGGVDLPRWALHIPIVEAAQIGATIRRVMDSKLRKSDKDTQGLSAGLMAGGVGLAEEIPFVKETVNMSKLMDQRERGNFIGEFAKSRLVPGLLQFTANKSDTKDGFFSDAIQRKPESLWEHIETGIPGLRQRVLSKAEAMDIKTATTDDMVDAIKDIRSQKKDSSRYETELVKKALNAQKAGSLTRDEVNRIKEVLPNFTLAPRVRKLADLAETPGWQLPNAQSRPTAKEAVRLAPDVGEGGNYPGKKFDLSKMRLSNNVVDLTGPGVTPGEEFADKVANGTFAEADDAFAKAKRSNPNSDERDKINEALDQAEDDARDYLEDTPDDDAARNFLVKIKIYREAFAASPVDKSRKANRH